MTDLPPQSRANAKPKAKSAGYLRLVLGLSLAANLAVAGFVLGMALDGGRHGPHHGIGRTGLVTGNGCGDDLHAINKFRDTLWNP